MKGATAHLAEKRRKLRCLPLAGNFYGQRTRCVRIPGLKGSLRTLQASIQECACREIGLCCAIVLGRKTVKAAC